jgi:hypothetical protein
MEVFGIASSGLQPSQTQFNVTANNIASQSTPGFIAQRADSTFGPNSSRAEVFGGQSTALPHSSAQSLLAPHHAGYLYAPNAMVIPVADQMYGTLLNVVDSQASSNGKTAAADKGATEAPLTGEPLVSEDPFRLLSGQFGYAPAFLIQFTEEKSQTDGQTSSR